jgi:hypothetical protein
MLLAGMLAGNIYLYKGADTNAVSKGGRTVLNAALLSPDGPDEGIIAVLLAQNVNLNPPNVAETPLQSAVRKYFSGGGHGTESFLRVLRKLLESGADVNAVGNDAAVVAMIRYEHRVECDQNIVEKRLRCRGKKHYYDTPLRMVDTEIEELSREEGNYEKGNILYVRDLLIKYGAQSLHLPPQGTDSSVEPLSEASREQDEWITGSWRRTPKSPQWI